MHFSVDQRNDHFFRDWPPKPEENGDDCEIVQRDPRLFPIRTPQPPRRPPLNNSIFNLDQETTFERSSSARLKANGNQRDESMKRLLEWKQRMLQSPLSRMENKARKEQKSKKFSISGKTSRAQTPVSSTQSPVIVHQRVTRKTSNGSRHSRARSLSRLSNRLSTSSSDEGKLAFHYVVSNNRCTFLFISSDLFYSRLSCITNDVGK